LSRVLDDAEEELRVVPRRVKGVVVFCERERRTDEPWAPVAPKTVMSFADIVMTNG